MLENLISPKLIKMIFPKVLGKIRTVINTHDCSVLLYTDQNGKLRLSILDNQTQQEEIKAVIKNAKQTIKEDNVSNFLINDNE